MQFKFYMYIMDTLCLRRLFALISQKHQIRQNAAEPGEEADRTPTDKEAALSQPCSATIIGSSLQR